MPGAAANDPYQRNRPDPGSAIQADERGGLMTVVWTVSRRLDADPESIDRDLRRLLLTAAELVRQLMERYRSQPHERG
jgi:hypothetical protein